MSRKKAGKMDAFFTHEPLHDPTNQIRLLEILPGADDTILQAKLSHHSLREAPQYSAISYAWGENDETPIQINDKTLVVRQTCYDALLQARLHRPGCYVWIDSICINQDIHIEKNFQVAMMGKIYQTASEVLACIGQTPDLKWLLSLKDDWRQHLPVEDMPGQVEWTRTKLRLYAELSDGERSRFQKAYAALKQQPYWSRVWVIQEFSVNDAVVLAGAMSATIWDLDHLLDIAECCLPNGYREPKTQWESTFVTTISLAVDGLQCKLITGERVPQWYMVEIFEKLRFHQCSDPRDRLYGVLSLIDWQTERHGPPLPDYSKSAWELAAELVSRKADDLRFVHAMFRAFGVHAGSVEMLDAVKRRSLGSVTGAPAGVPIVLPIGNDYCGGSILITRGPYGALEVDPRLRAQSIRGIQSSDLDETYDFLTQMRYAGSRTAAFNGHRPRRVTYRDETVALVPAATRPRDILVFPWSSPFSPPTLALVVRQNTGYYCYDIIGQAIICRCFEICRALGFAHVPAAMTCSVEDIMVMAGQDLDCSNDRSAKSPNPAITYESMLRLVTAPLAMPIRAIQYRVTCS